MKKEKEKEITFLIVNFNSSDFIKINLYSIFKLTKNKCKVIIVDNGSEKKDYFKLKEIVSEYKNVFLERFETDLRGSVAHGTALNHLVAQVKTPFFSILDADAIWLKKDWDEILISKMNENLCVIGTQAPIPKPQDFPLMFAILFETKTFKELEVDFRPQDVARHKDTGWEIREKYLGAGLSGKNIKLFETQDFKKGPFSDLITSEYYLEGEEHIFASHFGRGSSFGQAKYKKSTKLIMKIPVLRSYLAKLEGKKEKVEWIRICKEVIDKQVLKDIEMEKVECDFCGSGKNKTLFSARDNYNELPGKFYIVRCENCGLTFTNPRPTESSMRFYYPDSAGYFQSPKISEQSSFKKSIFNEILVTYFNYPRDERVSLVHKFLSQFIYHVKKNKIKSEGIPNFVRDGKLLDIGCSTGVYLNKMKQLGWDVMGIEPNKSAADFATKELDLNVENISLDSFEMKKRFDVVTLRMVLEHMHSPEKVFSSLKGRLKADGQVIVIVPDFSGFESKLFKSFAYTLQLPTHLFHFTPKTIEMYLEKSGFEVKEIVHHRVYNDFLKPFDYLKREGRPSGFLGSLFSNRFIKPTLTKFLIATMAVLGKTSRMTIYAKKKVV